MANYKGQLEGFPEEVVEKMLERQVEQGNERNVRVFEENRGATRFQGGFDWLTTQEGDIFWNDVIDENFELFFQRYPKQDPNIKQETIIWRKWPCEYEKEKKYLVITEDGQYMHCSVGFAKIFQDDSYIIAIAEVKGWQ